MQIVKRIRNSGMNELSVRTEQGFTLLELMIVVVIVSVLMGIALPSYTEYVNKGRRTDAMSALLDVANKQEQFMFDRNTYTTTMTQLGFAADPMVSQEGHYTIDAVAGGTGSIQTSYSLTATPRASSPQDDDDKCDSFTLTSTGTKTATGTHAADCWSR